MRAMPGAMSADRRPGLMRNDDHDGTEAFHCTTANSTAMSAHADALVLPERPMLEATNSDLSVMRRSS
jgi:hypothetical protein